MKTKCCSDPQPLQSVLTGRVADPSPCPAPGLISGLVGVCILGAMDRLPRGGGRSRGTMSYDRVAAFERETVCSERGTSAPRSARGRGSSSSASGASRQKAAPAIERGSSARGGGGGGGTSGTPSSRQRGASSSGKAVAVRQGGGRPSAVERRTYERGIVAYERATADLHRGTIAYEQGTVLYERGGAEASHSRRGTASRGRAIAAAGGGGRGRGRGGGGGGGGGGGRKTSVNESGVVYENLSFGGEGSPSGSDLMLFYM